MHNESQSKSPMTATRRTFLRGGLAAATLGATGVWLPETAAAATVPFVPYGADSFFHSRVAGAPVDAAGTSSFKSFMKSHPDQRAFSWPKITGTGSNQWGTTFHLSKSSDPVWKISAGTKSQTAILAGQGFHMADVVASRIPTGTQDRPFLIVDPVFGYSLFCADVVPNMSNRTIKVSAAAVFHHSSNGLDGRNPRSNDRRNWNSRGRITDSMVIRADVLKAAIANGTGLGYVLQMFFVETSTSAGVCSPMVGAENNKSGWGAEGQRIAIRADVHLPGRGLSDGALVVARTLQQHGCYLGDNSGSSSQLKGEQSSPSYNPWAGTNVSVDCLKNKITWDDFVVLPKGWQ